MKRPLGSTIKPENNAASPAAKPGGGAILVAAGILLSRIAGLIRESIFAHYFGASTAADAFKAALRIPNFLQNMFGEGVLSASFVPVYAKLAASGEDDLKRRVASAVFSIITLAASILSLLGIIFTPELVDIITPGFSGESRELSITLVRIFFPGTAVLVCSAWCLGVLNSHKRFFLPYVSPVLWNGAIIAALVMFGGLHEHEAIIKVAWGVTVGSFLQFLVQFPQTLRLIGGLVPLLGLKMDQVRLVIRNFVPVFIGRGVVQLSAFIDTIIASWLPSGSLAILAYALNIYLLPIGLFGMSVSVVELTQISHALAAGGDQGSNERVLERLAQAQRQILFFVVPTTAVFFVFGSEVISALYQTGRFSSEDTHWVWLTLAGLSLGLITSAVGRLYASLFYSLHDSRTPLNFSLIRVALSTGVGYFTAIYLPPALKIDQHYGIFFLAAATGASSWVDCYLLRRAIKGKFGAIPALITPLLLVGAASAAGVLGAAAVKQLLPIKTHLIREALVLAAFGATYLLAAYFLKIDELKKITRRLRPKLTAQ